MERRGARAAAPDRRRDDLAPAHRRADRARLLARDRARARREPRRRRRLGPARPRPARGARRARTASCRSGCASSTPRSCESRCCRSPRPRANRRRGCATTTCRPPRSPARASSSPTLAELVPYIDWQFFFHAWDLKGKFPAILEQPGGAGALRRRDSPLLDEIVASGSLQRARRLRLLAGARRGRRRRRRRDALLLPAPAGRARRRPAEPLPRRLRRAGGRPLGAFAVAIHGADELRGPLRGRARRLPRDHRQGARRPPRRGVRRVAAPAGAPRVVRARRAALGTDDLLGRALPRHPAGVRLPRLPGSQREGEALRPARRPRDRDRADRELRDDPGRRGQRDLPRRTRRRDTSRSAGSAATSSRTTRLVRGNPCYKSSSGCGQISRSSRAHRARLRGRRALADAPTVRITSADQAKAVAALLQHGRTSARAGQGGTVEASPLTSPNCPGFDPKESDLASPATPTRASPSSRAGVELDQDVEVLRSAASVETDFARTISPELGQLPRLPARAGCHT